MSDDLINAAVTPQHLKVKLEAEDKNGIIRELLDILDRGGVLSDRAAAEKVVFEREKCMSTGLEAGIAIPHGKTDTVERLIVAIGLKPEGVDFDSGDGQPSQIFILTLSPASRSGPHIRFLAEISRLLQDAAVREQLLAAQTPEQMAAILKEEK